MNEEKITELLRIYEIARNDPNILTVSATVDTGFEWTAIEECREKISLNLRVFKAQGKIYFNIPVTDYSKVKQLRSVDNIYVVADVQYLSYSKDDKQCNINLFRNSIDTNTELTKHLNIWKKCTNFSGKIFPTKDEYDSIIASYKAEKIKRDDDMKDKDAIKGKRKRAVDPALSELNDILSFRVTCERNGTHNFDSQEIAGALGATLQDKFNWIVDLTTYHLEVLSRITDDEMILLLRVTPESMHRRNIISFGPTTLRATICYNLLRLANPKPGDIIVDPMCGGGSIPIESALELSSSYSLGGDNNAKAMIRSKENFDGLEKNYKLDFVKWNIIQLPYKDSSIDAIVTDLPFGKRIGSVTNNRVLYKKGLMEFARVTRMKYGRLVLLTHDRRSISMALSVVKDFLKIKKTLKISIGGLNAAVYVLKRTNLAYTISRLYTEKNKSNSEAHRTSSSSSESSD